jgi:hypothetical protein
MATWEASRRLYAKGSAKLISGQSGLGPIPQGFAETYLSNNDYLNCMNVIELASKPGIHEMHLGFVGFVRLNSVKLFSGHSVFLA